MSAAWLTGYTKKPGGHVRAEALLLHLLLDSGVATQPGDGHEVQVVDGELGKLRDPGLDDDGGGRRIDPDREIVESHLEHVPSHQLGLLGVVGQRLYVGDQHVRRVRSLELDPILERADVVTEVQGAGGPVAREDGLHRAPPLH